MLRKKQRKKKKERKEKEKKDIERHKFCDGVTCALRVGSLSRVL